MEAAPGNSSGGVRSAHGGISYRRLLWAAPLAGAVAAALNAIVWLVAYLLGAMPQDLIVNDIGPIFIDSAMTLSFVPAIFAGLLLAILARFSRRPGRVFVAISALVLVISFATPFGIEGAPLAMILALELMHVVAAAAIVGVLLRFARR